VFNPKTHPIALGACLLFLGCDSVQPGADALEPVADVSEKVQVELVDNRLWVRVTGNDDPWDGTKSDDVDACEEPDLSVEELDDGPWFDMTTKGCAYLTVHQKLKHDVPKDALLTLRIWHYKITVWEGTFHLAYQIGTEPPPEWEVQKEVPAESGLIYEQWHASRDYLAGDDVYFHLANHGDNSWSLIEFSAEY
jgi:hypothetical protein